MLKVQTMLKDTMIVTMIRARTTTAGMEVGLVRLQRSLSPRRKLRTQWLT